MDTDTFVGICAFISLVAVMYWKWIYPPLIGFFLQFFSMTAVIWMVPAVFLIKWDKEPTVGSYGLFPTIRGDLPKWLSWLETPDERLPGGLYEPTVNEMLARKGKVFTSWYWLGVRNQMMNLACYLGVETTDYIPETLGYFERDNVWRYAFKIGRIKFVMGHQVYKLLNGKFVGAPVFTIKAF